MYVRSPSTAEPDCHHQIGSGRRARLGFGKWDVRDEARVAALERNALATGTGVTLGMAVETGVEVAIAEVAIVVVVMIEVDVATREDVVSEVVVLSMGWMVKSGKNTAAAAAKAEGRRIVLVLFLRKDG